ncbi:MAG: hypothetical protein Kow0025_11740 [Thermodesulfovibrionales bacterium]
MKKLIKKLEDVMVAITFAEAGEFETALEITKDPPAKGSLEPSLEVDYESLGS